MDIATYVKKAREERHMSQRKLAIYSGLSNTTISRIENSDINPDPDTLVKLASGFKIQPKILFEICGYIAQEGTRAAEIPKGVRIPVLGRVPAGSPIEAIEDIIDWEDIPLDMAAHGEYFGLQVMGTSMEPQYLDGDILIVRQQPTAETGDDVVATVNGDDATFKRISISESGLVLKPLNPAFDPLIFTKEQVEQLPVTVLGIVEEIRRKVNRKT